MNSTAAKRPLANLPPRSWRTKSVASEAWVSDSSPLILLGKIGHLDLLVGSSERLLIPQAVADEVAAKADGARLIAELSAELRVSLVRDLIIPPELLAWDLGPGETQAIACARQRAARAILDDLEARRCAAAMDVKTIGTCRTGGARHTTAESSGRRPSWIDCVKPVCMFPTT